MKKILLGLLMAGICSVASAGLNDKISIDLRDTDIRDVCKLISSQAKIGIVTEKSVRGMVTISLREVSARDALDLVTQSNGFAWAQLNGAILVTDERRLGRSVKVFNLKHASADEAARIISSSIAEDMKIAVCQENNSLVINGYRKGLDEAMQIIGHLDRPGKYVKASLKFICGDQVLQKYEFTARAGSEVRFSEQFKFAPVQDGKNRKFNMVSLDCALQVGGISGSGLLDGQASIKIKRIDKAENNEVVRDFVGQFRAEKGTPAEVLVATQNDPVKVLFTWEK